MKAILAKYINEIFRKYGYEIKATASLPKQNLLGMKNNYSIRTVLDAGANLGQFAEWARSEFPTSTIHSFEPVQTTYHSLQAKAQRDPLWHCYNLALSSETCVRDINVHVDHLSSSSFLDSTQTTSELFPSTIRKVKSEVSCVTLDEWVSDSSTVLEEDVLLKMDVQGYEASILQGGQRTLLNVQVVITEVNIERLYHSQTTFPELVSLLDKACFEFVGVLEHGFSANGNPVSLDAVFMKRRCFDN